MPNEQADGQVAEMQAMLGTMEGQVSNDEVVEEAVVEEVVEEVVVEEEVVEDAALEEEEVVDDGETVEEVVEEVVDGVGEEKEVTPEDLMQEQLQALREQVEYYNNQRVKDLVSASKPVEPVQAELIPKMAPVDIQFVTEEDLLEATSDPKKLNALLQGVYQRAVNDALRAVPEMARKAVPQTNPADETARRVFYEANPDLVNFESTVILSMVELRQTAVAEGWPDSKLLEELPKMARKRLGLVQPRAKKRQKVSRNVAARTPVKVRVPKARKKEVGKYAGLDEQQKHMMGVLDAADKG